MKLAITATPIISLKNEPPATGKAVSLTILLPEMPSAPERTHSGPRETLQSLEKQSEEVRKIVLDAQQSGGNNFAGSVTIRPILSMERRHGLWSPVSSIEAVFSDVAHAQQCVEKLKNEGHVIDNETALNASLNALDKSAKKAEKPPEAPPVETRPATAIAPERVRAQRIDRQPGLI